MKQNDQPRIQPEQGRFQAKDPQDANVPGTAEEFVQVLYRIDFSRDTPVRERVRARILDKARNELDTKQSRRKWTRTSRIAVAYIGGALLLVVAAILFAWGIERLVPSQGMLLASNPTATATSVASTPTVIRPTPAPMFGPTQDRLYLSNANVIANHGGLETAVRSGPGMGYPQVGQLKDGEQAPALGKTSLGEWIKILYPDTLDGTGWVYASQVVISGAELPILADVSMVPPAVTPGANLLGPQSSSEEIRNLILHPIWTVIWVDGQAVHHLADGGSIGFFVQAWLDQTGKGRVISSAQMENVATRSPDLPPKWIWLSDGKSLRLYDTETRSFDPSMAHMRWTVHPLESAGELMGILFPFYLEPVGNQPIQVVREESFSDRPALVIDWGRFRLWLDETSGVILRQQTFSVQDHTRQAESDLFLSRIVYEPQWPSDLLDAGNLDQLRFQAPPVEPNAEGRALDAIRRFSPQSVTGYTVQKGVMNPNLPGLLVDRYAINGLVYDIDPQTGRVVEFTDNSYSTEGTRTYASDQLEQMAVQLVQEQLPEVNLNDFFLERGSKAGGTFFFRWSKAAAGEPGYLTFIQVGYTSHGTLIGYLDTLSLMGLEQPSATPTPPSATATERPTGKVYFSVVSSTGSDPWTKIGWLSLDCLAEPNACQSSIQTLPDSYQKNMADAPVWSPDGKRFALVGNSIGETSQDIFIMDANGEHSYNLTHSPEREDHPAWSPDGTYLLYTRSSSNSEIWISLADGSGQRKVVEGYIPAWSPDSQQILYIASRNQNGQTIVAISNLSGGNPVWEMTVEKSVYYLAWSPDGSKFIVSTSEGALLMNRDGTLQNQITANLFHITNVVWSPDGQYLTFSAGAARQAPPDLYTIHADGSGLVNLTQSSLGVVSPAAWSPDSQWLVYDSPQNSGNGNIFISSADGTKRYQLTQSDGSLDYLTSSWQP